MPTKPHNALFVRFTGLHYHVDCLTYNATPPPNDIVHLDMNLRANIAQCLHVLCYGCSQIISMFPDRKQIVLRQWPDMSIPDVDQAVAFAQAAIGQLVLEDGKPYTVLHAWTVPPLEGQPGAVVAICELEEVEEQEPEPAPTPPHTGPLARERFTPLPWEATTGTTYGADRCFIRSQHPSMAEQPLIGWAFLEADARLIAEAPNMFALLKEFIEREETPYERQMCECHICAATRRLIKRVLGEV